MSGEMCKHGYLPGMCPKGCEEDTADASKETGAEHPPVRYNELPPIEKLDCAICNKTVEDGRVFRGKAICKTCEDGLKGEAPKEPEVPNVNEPINELPRQD